MFDAGRNYVILAAALLVLAASLKLYVDTNTGPGGISLAGAKSEKCQPRGFSLSTMRADCKGSGAAFSR